MKPKHERALKKFEDEMPKRRLADSTMDQYRGWVRRYLAHVEDHPAESVEAAITAFLSELVPCSVANQKGALAALAGGNGLYNCLGYEVGELPKWVKAQRPVRIKVWLTQAEVEAILPHLPEPWRTMAGLMFGSGLRVGECVSLRWDHLDLERGTVSIRSGKGDKDRIAPLSRRLVEPLLERRERCRGMWQEDRDLKRPGVAPVPQLEKKYPNHGVEWPFFFVFPAKGESKDKKTGIVRRHHTHARSFAKPMRVALRRSGIDKRATAHSFRHGFATAYLLAGGNLRELQERMGHENIDTTMGYLHCLPQQFDRIGSPWDVEPAASVEHFPKIVPFPTRRRA